jgi:hypothetical protein
MITSPKPDGFSFATVNVGSKRLKTSFDRAALPHFPRRNLHLAIPTLLRFSRTGTLFPIRLFHSQLLLGTGIAVCNAA